MLFVVVVLVLELGLFALLFPVLGTQEAASRAVATLPPVLWTARLAVALATGRISRRLERWGGPGVNRTFLRLTNPDVFDRHEQPWNFFGYTLFESLLCLVLWAMWGGSVVLAPLLAALGVDV